MLICFGLYPRAVYYLKQRIFNILNQSLTVNCVLFLSCKPKGDTRHEKTEFENNLFKDEPWKAYVFPVYLAALSIGCLCQGMSFCASNTAL